MTDKDLIDYIGDIQHAIWAHRDEMHAWRTLLINIVAIGSFLLGVAVMGTIATIVSL